MGYLRCIWIIINSNFVILVHFIYMILLSPLFYFGGKNGKNWYYKIEETFYEWILYILDFTISSLDFKIVESGDNLKYCIQEDQNILFMPNHQSVADVLICITVLLMYPGYARKIMWVIGKNERFSNYGLMSWLHDDCFLDTRKTNPRKSLEDLTKHLKQIFQRRDRKCIILFPEGGFLSKKKSSSSLYAMKNKLPMLCHVAYPKIGALQTILDTLYNDVTEKENMSPSVLKANVHEVCIY